VSRYQKGKTNLDFTEARESEWQWHQLGYMQVLHLTPDSQPRQYLTNQFLTDRMPFLPPTNSVKSLLEKLMGQTDTGPLLHAFGYRCDRFA